MSQQAVICGRCFKTVFYYKEQKKSQYEELRFYFLEIYHYISMKRQQHNCELLQFFIYITKNYFF